MKRFLGSRLPSTVFRSLLFYLPFFSLAPILLCSPAVVFSQQTWMRTYGGADFDYGMSVQQTYDGGYIVCGTTNSFPGDINAYLIRTNALGDTLWTRVFGGADIDAGNAVLQDTDSTFVLAGVTYAPDGRVYLIKVASGGDTLWMRSWRGVAPYEGAADAQRTWGGGYILTGWSGSPGVYDVLIVKTNASGDTLWTKTYGGHQNATGYSVCQTADSGFIVVGEIQRAKKETVPGEHPILQMYPRDRQVQGLPFLDRRGRPSPPGNFPAQYDIYLLKTNTLGDTLWSKLIGGTGDEIGEGVRQTSDGGYIIVGRTTSFGAGSGDVYLVKTDSLGDTLWTKTYGGPSWDFGYALDLTPDGGFVLVGATSSVIGDTSQIYLLKTDAQGNLRWARTLGGSGQEWGYSVRTASDGGFIITGSTTSYGAGLQDVYLIKTDTLGNVGVETPVRSLDGLTVGRFTATPNPFTSFATLPGHEAEQFTLYDISGRKVGTYKGDRIGEGLGAGVYFLRPVGQGGKPLRVVKIR